MKFKLILINLFVTLISIYTPLFFFSFYKFLSNPKSNVSEKNFNLEIEAVKNGYLPLFYPDQILKNENVPQSYPIGTLPLTPTYLCDEGYGLITFKSDRFGLRNKDNNWNNIMNKSNIFIVGDSFAQGACVPEESSITNQLEESTKKNIINMGTASNGPYEYKAIIKLMLENIIKNSKENNTAILIFYANDDLPINQKKQNLLDSKNSIISIKLNGDVVPKAKYVKDINKYIKENYPTTKDELIREIRKNYLNNLKDVNSFKHTGFYYIVSLFPIRRALRIVLTKLPQKNFIQNTERPSMQAIESLANNCVNLCKPIVAYIPPSNYWTRYLKANNFKKKLKNISNNYGIRFIDGEEVIDRNDITDYAPEAEHLSLKGYKKFTDLIKKNLNN